MLFTRYFFFKCAGFVLKQTLAVVYIIQHGKRELKILLFFFKRVIVCCRLHTRDDVAPSRGSFLAHTYMHRGGDKTDSATKNTPSVSSYFFFFFLFYFIS